MMGEINNGDVHMSSIKSVNDNCPNIKEFYAAGLFIYNEEFSIQTLKPFFGRLEKIVLQHGGFGDVKTFADCKKLKEWTQENLYGFDGSSLNLNFPELRSINFSKVDQVDNEYLALFLSKNPQLKSISLTRCTITPKILELLSRHVPNIEEFAFNFRRSLVRRCGVQKNLKHLLELKNLKVVNLDCVGVAMGDTLMNMASYSSLKRVGLFCCPWDNKLIEAFGNLKNLQSLHLSNVTGLNDECLEQLSPSLIGLTDLTLKFIDSIIINGVLKLMIECQRLTTVNLCLKKMTTISNDRYNMLLEAIKKRPEKSKLTITLWGSTNPLKLPKDLLKKNIEFLEIRSEEEEVNKNTDFDFYCDSADGGYDLINYAPPPCCCSS